MGLLYCNVDDLGLCFHNSFGPDGGSQSRTDIHTTFSSVTRDDCGVLLCFPQRSQRFLQKFCRVSGKHCDDWENRE